MLVLSWIMRAIPVRWWSVTIAVGAFAFWYKGVILLYLARAIPHDVVYPEHRHERLECLVDSVSLPTTTAHAASVPIKPKGE